MSTGMDRESARAILGESASLRKGLPPTFAELVEIRKAEGSFDQLMTSRQLEDWLPGAMDALASTIWAALNLEGEGEELTPELRAKAVERAFDEFAEAGKKRLKEAIGKRHAGTARVAKFSGFF